ncbi:hypothetical protein [Mycolicibacterium aubagnense]|uniref:Uncharacterized protein n=1 Tax=Mycolicibacterium aubagnense TaxID=319707 RepID=A0ABM7IME4_9MYCO|nr:hypothetical protein [Mycolicibacterium aubagnense]TLH64254.1 hypothetical protein C1S80_12640 [Mycolicibacterium aubagnense]BBX87895.1 hypothetical protein MAUB_57680 [Mycolicibacterium aubagnense]
MIKPISELVTGDRVVAFVLPGCRLQVVRGGPFEVDSVVEAGGEWEGAPQIKIVGTSRTRAARYANGATHVEVQ